MQKRYLTDTMLNLHDKFKAEHPHLNVSYTTFTRQRPFYDVAPNVHQRDTVKCKLHHNCEFKADTLHRIGILKHKNPHNVIKDIVCSVSEETCMYQKCDKCKNNWANMYIDIEKTQSTESVRYIEWQRETEERINTKGSKIQVTVSKKIEKKTNIKDLCTLFETDMVKLMSHQFRISHQYKQLKMIKENLDDDECVVQIDFSENYLCKAETEIQSMHFVGSSKQLSLHTSHVTFNDTVDCYCTVSEDIRHSAESAWSHLTPVLTDLSEKGMKVIHFVSDGPTTQYRNKTNFHLLASLPFTTWDFEHVTYNFLEAGHGKGPADGIGAAVKNSADRLVAHGNDVLGAKQLINSLKARTKVKLHEITTEQINLTESLARAANITPVKGTMKIHQIVASKEHRGTIFHRELSCFCNKRSGNKLMCNCFSPNKFEVDLSPASSVQSIESRLSKDQIIKFQRQLVEGYDVIMDSLDSLEEDAKLEYMYWKAWRAAKLQVNTSRQNETETDAEAESESEQSHESDSEWEAPSYHSKQLGKAESVPLSPTDEDTQQSACSLVHVDRYYAVFFHTRGTKKGKFYIGRIMATDGITAKIKFLERKYGRSNQFDWPKRDDMATVNNTFILKEVEFCGPPPFVLNGVQIKKIQHCVLEMSTKLSQQNKV